MAEAKLCAVEDCGKPSHVKGYCNIHYQRARRHGNPLGVRTLRGDPLRFIREVVLPYEGDECLMWPFSRTKKGYGRLEVDGKHRTASGYVCEQAHGKPPTPEHECAHACGKGHEGCVTPAHLSWKTQVDNQADKLVHGTLNQGERCGTAKLTEADVKEIRAMQGLQPLSAIADAFGVSKSAVHAIHQRKSWKFI